MATPSFRDRLLSPGGARAVTSPVGIALAVVVAVVAVVVGVPLAGALVLGLAVWLANVVRLLPRPPRRPRIDPFTLHDPWRRFVQDALQARTRFTDAAGRAPSGPLQDRLREIAGRVEVGVEECWRVAQRGEALVEARRGIDIAEVDRRLADLGAVTPGESSARLVESFEVQKATAERLDRVIAATRDQLRLLDARLDEAVARALELSASAHAGTGIEGLRADVDGVVTEMEALRLALEETNAAAGGELPGGDARS